MPSQKISKLFKRALLIEDNLDICDFYRDFFEIENLSLDILHEIPTETINVGDTYDILVCDWLIGPCTVKNWIESLYSHNQLPQVTVVATGMLGIDDQLEGLPIQLIYKPFDFDCLRDIFLNLRQSRLSQI